MSRTILAKYVTPWKFKRQQHEQRLRALRQRDGDDCRRCRRPLSFDLPSGHEKAPTIEQIAPQSNEQPLDSLCLCHGRCNAESGDHTPEVQERLRRKSEAALLSRPRKASAKR
jgi:hypothetical protein